jgi:hypothetical protein
LRNPVKILIQPSSHGGGVAFSIPAAHMTAMEQEIIKPEGAPRQSSQAFSPVGSFMAAFGATLLIFCFTGASMVASVWAFSKLLGLPEILMYVVMAAGAIPVLWATAWTGGRAWHVEQLLASHKDIDAPVFTLGHYLRKR